MVGDGGKEKTATKQRPRFLGEGLLERPGVKGSACYGAALKATRALSCSEGAGAAWWAKSWLDKVRGCTEALKNAVRRQGTCAEGGVCCRSCRICQAQRGCEKAEDTSVRKTFGALSTSRTRA